MNLEKLKEPFAPSDVSWRIGQAGKGRNGIWAKVLAYIDNRNIQDRLDAVCGPENWWNTYAPGPGGGVVCGITIRTEKGEVTKWDGAENSDIEPVKGGLSDSMKRAAVQWGIGRYLYDLGENWAEICDGKREGSHYANCKVKIDGKEEWIQFDWLPPRLPAFAVPKADPSSVARANEAAAKANLTTGDKVRSPLFKTIKEGLDSINASAANASSRLTKADDFIYEQHKAGKITAAEKEELEFMVAEIQKEIDGHKKLDKQAATAAA